ncbi:hypothetical protein ACWKSP_20350 [Micromonosporaceae bacterium Da 78-11]
MPRILRCLIAAALLALISAGPATAAPAATTVDAHLGQVTVAPGGAPKIALLWGLVHTPTGTEDPVHRFDFTVDLRAVSAFADVELLDGAIVVLNDYTSEPSSGPDEGPCRRTPTTITCSIEQFVSRRTSLNAFGALVVRPTASAKIGDSARIPLTARVDGGAVSTSESLVRVGEGVDLAGGRTQEISAAPGGSAPARPVVRNVGATAVNGVAMSFAVDPRLLSKTSFRNCWYGYSILYTFDSVPQPGKAYGLSAPLILRPPVDSVPGSVAPGFVQWMTATELQDWTDSFPTDTDGSYGTGAALTLDELTGALDVPQADLDPDNDSSTILLTVDGPAPPDLAAVGARLTGAVGDIVTVEVGQLNLGPGTLRPDLYPNNALTTEIRMPQNVSALALNDCDEQQDGGDAVYRCQLQRTLKPGGRDLYSFDMEIERRGGSAGQVEVSDLPPPVAGTRRTGRENNVARIVVTVSGEAAGLPITGAGGYLAAGLVLLAVGAAAVLVARRRDPAPR